MIPAPKTHIHKVSGITLTENLTILLFGPTGSGKTPMIGELAEYFFAHYKLKTRVYASDRGGWETIRPHIELGFVDIQLLFGDPWEWLHHAVKGDVWSGDKWLPGLDPTIGLYAFEGLTSISDALMSWMANESARGVNIGGQGAFNFRAGADKKLVIGTSNIAHYGVAQQHVREKAWQSQALPGALIWTAGDRRGEDDASGGIIGPQLAGKALTPEIPQWFKYTFRLTKEVAAGQTSVKHVLYLEDHVEMAARMATGISNARVPLAGGETVKVPSRIEPASLVAALELLESRQVAAKDEIKRRIGL